MNGARSIQLTAFEKVQVEQAKAYVDAHLQENLDAEDVALQHSISPYKLKAGFVQQTGCSFAVYVKKKRMERARELLLHTNKIVYEIARICGYRDTSSFTRAFKNYFGCTPDAYRKN